MYTYTLSLSLFNQDQNLTLPILLCLGNFDNGYHFDTKVSLTKKMLLSLQLISIGKSLGIAVKFKNPGLSNTRGRVLEVKKTLQELTEDYLPHYDDISWVIADICITRSLQ